MRRPSWLTLAAAAGLFAALALPRTAAAQSIIKNPGQHPQGPELEPHLILRPFDTPDGDLGLGLGFRATFQIGQNNFIGSINNSVGIGVGLDWMRYRGCGRYRYGGRDYDCDSQNAFVVPVVMQWSFYLSRSWSVFGEPGIAASFYNGGCSDLPGDPCGHSVFTPILFAGGRWHFADNVTLTMRIGWPYASVGVSFM
jgi:hypothetical protein